MTRIDVNADLGEGMGTDEAILPLVSSANIACGGHAGDESTMRATVTAAVATGVRIGAHPGYPDRDGFGRTSMDLGDAALRRTLDEQLDALDRVTRAANTRIEYIKPHGALYHDATDCPEVARAIVDAAATRRVAVMGFAPLPRSGTATRETAFQRAARERGVPFIAEAFVDRGYADDGTLIPRGTPGALLTGDAGARAVALAHAADSLCVHGDSPGAVQTAREVRDALVAAGIKIGAGA